MHAQKQFIAHKKMIASPSLSLSIPTRPPVASALPISVSTASHPDPVVGGTSSIGSSPTTGGTASNALMLGMKRRRTGSPSSPSSSCKAPRLMASVPMNRISKRPSILGGFHLPASSVPTDAATAALAAASAGPYLIAKSEGSSSSSSEGEGEEESDAPRTVPLYLTSSYSKASAASTRAISNQRSCGDRGSGSGGRLPRSTSTQSLPGFSQFQSCEVTTAAAAAAPAAAPTGLPASSVDDSNSNIIGSIGNKAHRPHHERNQEVSASKKIRPSFPRSVSLPSVMSPQVCLDTILKTRGYSTQNYCSLESGYYCKPTPYQKASYGIRLVQAVRTADRDLLASLLSAGLSSNPCNSFGESIVHMVCRRGCYDLLRVLVDEAGCTLQVSDDFGRTPLHDACWTAAPNFRLVDLILQADVRLLRVVDCRGSSPLSYVKRENWDLWVDYFESRKDDLWPVRDVKSVGPEGPPGLVGVAPHSRPVPDPVGAKALPLGLVEMVSSGRLGPDEARRKMTEEEGAAKNDGRKGKNEDEIKIQVAPIAAA